ncbi:MAG TPA: metallophosphoesterase [Ktedonobacteraceae bacterium]|jgi:diadenosine tetraphosphatase ApaH/serine/threonine PP2A family protein phosphatase|nr:metallophosphoesterase [Ktedonobacteraceae bacterium]
MRYAIFTDIHANLEALEAVLAKIEELAQQEPIEQIWFLGDLVGYGPNPNECIDMLRARTDVIIAGNHDWAAVGKISLEDFSEAARVSAEWTAKQLSDENRDFLINLPERIEKDICTLVHGSPYGPLWEYLTSEVLAERSFEYFNSLYCFVGHTHVPVIFQQPDIANTPTIPLSDAQQQLAGIELTPEDLQPLPEAEEDDDETQKLVVVRHTLQNNQAATSSADEAHLDTEPHLDPPDVLEHASDIQHHVDDEQEMLSVTHANDDDEFDILSADTEILAALPARLVPDRPATIPSTQDTQAPDQAEDDAPPVVEVVSEDELLSAAEVTPEDTIANAEDRLNQEIEELLTLLGLTQNTTSITNEMIIPPEDGPWKAPRGYRAIVNPGGVGQPRDGNPKAAFMIFDPERGFQFYRVPYDIEKTQEKIIEAGLPKYLATRLSYGR